VWRGYTRDSSDGISPPPPLDGRIGEEGGKLMTEQQTRRIEGAARLFAEALAESYRTATDRTVSAQELNAQLMQQFFNGVVDNLRDQTDNILTASRDLAEQTQRGQEAAQALTQESIGAYIDFMTSLFPIKESDRDTEGEKNSPKRSSFP
jgi:hypothetical protein